ncbi:MULTISPECIES: flagellar assembly peptidoglycan hydrolase FlgJ [Dickeya]|uniref:Peptidoglycan hydrolase FlgJ n=1 Tax=Dickeya fangzhongdai TaxID=1778540 RepID=A0A2K8QPT1_9GAMM|nr:MULTISPECIES: flagellar assembly peptidoglycan hydrolase FlgJ [Dickeya]ATZ95028.1 flagellar assembly peptidoglycan hydrolase FlgJ [Dickeya fangzhongdai]AYH48730.1 flagellar assembly peptidoglycan hydrolase FlgJ [Dickeya fangzhongdai]MBO8132291.1 flagellar assembly peptidoglycan hydrolase FlgJ [Dickeya fangzhongdai]QOH48470.1 flagellar assembly peptidoglycan hydrolase FlgJ [Dickeya fangzhongdai]QOH52773.1 flagellar assembly peptidoglycan hydrolase FlgJ [Dickeya fangzhongdai]
MSDMKAFNNPAYETQSLNSLKRDVSSHPQSREGIRAVAKQLEGVFVQMMMKSMRDALPKDGIFSSDQTRMLTSMYDQQLAQQMSSGKGLGLASVIEKQMMGQGIAGNEPASTAPFKPDGQLARAMPSFVLEQMVRKAVPKLPEKSSALPMSSTDFISRLSTPAMLVSQQSGIPHHLIMAQAALESGWGQREIPTADGRRSHNIFGIKAGSSWDGPVTEVTTTEYEQGIAKKVKAAFRVYGSYLEALNDYAKLLTQNPRYAGVSAAATAEQAAVALQQAGYATDPAYAKKLVSMIQQMKNSGEKAVQAYTHDLSGIF